MLLVVMIFFLAFTIGGIILERQEKKQEKAKKEKSRRIKRMRQQQQAEELDKLYQDLMLEKIWQ